MKDVHVEKEVLSLASKAGVSQGAIQDVLDALIDDGLVNRRKIAGANYLWSFPAAADRGKLTKFEAMKEGVAGGKRKLAEAEGKLQTAGLGREDPTGSRASKLARIAELSAGRAALQAELEVLKESDPQVLADLQKELRLARDAANRWTDNVFACKGYLTKKRGFEGKEAERMIGITGNFDYPEDK
ncbi:hypothetical protein TeGR_g9744, partial [Tetraparma gracilis]